MKEKKQSTAPKLFLCWKQFKITKESREEIEPLKEEFVSETSEKGAIEIDGFLFYVTGPKEHRYPQVIDLKNVHSWRVDRSNDGNLKK